MAGSDPRRPGVHWNWPLPAPVAGSKTIVDGIDKGANGVGGLTLSRGPDLLLPNLYDLILEVGSDAGLDAYFENVVRALSRHFGAERASICVPTDPTDITNVPWGVKALWNKRRPLAAPDGWTDATRRRQQRSEGEGDGFHGDDREDAWRTDDSDQSDDSETLHDKYGDYRQHMVVFPKLKSLDFEEDPLIDGQGVVSLLDQNETTVLLQRRYVETENLGAREFHDSEQQLYSPWTRSPAPSPAVREYTESPFFARAQEMEEAFHPVTAADTNSTNLPSPNGGVSSGPDVANSVSTADSLSSSNVGPLDAIGWEDTFSLIHVLLVVPTHGGVLGKDGSGATRRRPPAAPIAILSMMSTLIPFPSKLRGLLNRFAPFLATAYLQSNVHNNLSKQIVYLSQHLAAMTRRRPSYSDLSLSPARRNSDHTQGSPGRLRASLRALDRQGKMFSVLGEDDEIKKTVQIALNGGDAVSSEVAIDDSQHHHNHHHNLLHLHHQSWRRRRRRPRANRPRSYGGGGFVFDSTNEHENGAGSPEPRRSAFEMLRPSYGLLKTIIEAIPAHVFTVDPSSGDITWVSNRTLAFRGVTAEEFCRNPFQSIHPDDKSKYVETWQDALETGLPWGQVLQIRRFDGRYKEFIMRAVPLKDEKGIVAHWFCTMMDIHKQKQEHVEAFKRAHEIAADDKYQKLAESSPIIVFTLEPLKGVVYANRKWHDYSGLTAEETYGYQYIRAVHPDDREKAGGGQDSEFERRIKKEGSYSAELRLRNKQGEYRWHLTLFTRSEAKSATGETNLWFGTCTDIHDQKLLQEKLREAKDAAQRTIESKSRFLSNMSHEIRTPLIGISGMISFLLDTPLTEEQLDYCHTISSSSEALLMVINDILDLSKVESGKMTLAYEWFKVRRLVEETNELLSSMAISKNLELNYVINDKVPVWIKADRIRLRQVMLNLIGNAIKFTDKGEIYTYCTVDDTYKGSPNTAMLRMKIHDTGRGFNQEDAERIFAPYSQLQNSYYRPTNGTGLGLVISRQLIQLHGGHLTCHSEKDKGSTFQFTCRITLATADDHPSTEVYSKDKEHTLAAEGRQQPENGNSTNGSSRTLEDSPTASDVALSAAERTRILVVCPLKFTCTSIIHHIRATVQDPSLCEISTVSGYDDAVRELNSKGLRGKSFTHVIINLLEVSETAQLLQYAYAVTTARLVVITSPAQKTNINRALSREEAVRKSVTFLEKPTKPSRYSNVFDPTKRREESYDTKMASAHAAIKTQRSVFHELGEFARGRHYRILVAEDNLVNQKVMAKFLVKAGFECDLAVDGVDCTAKFFAVQAGYYDLILCDLDMPRKDGFQTCVDIRAREKDNGHKPVPIVALSAYVMSDVAARCNEVGFTDYISKPVEFSVLKDAIIGILGTTAKDSRSL